MAFDFGYVSVGVGPFYFMYRFGGDDVNGGEDHGAQYAMLHTLEGYGATVFVTDQGKSNTGLNGWFYHVKGYNAGPYATHCKLQGGGCV